MFTDGWTVHAFGKQEGGVSFLGDAPPFALWAVERWRGHPGEGIATGTYASNFLSRCDLGRESRLRSARESPVGGRAPDPVSPLLLLTPEGPAGP